MRALICIAGCALGALATASNIDDARMQRLESGMHELVDSGRRTGLVWLVAKDGEVVASGAEGWLDKEHQVPMTTDAVFRIYSMTRAVTAVAVLQLVGQGLVALDDPIARYLPELAKLQVLDNAGSNPLATATNSTPITIRHLLTYTSGFAYAPQYPEGIEVDHRDILGLDQPPGAAMAKLASYPLRDRPGERWRYGYHSDVLGVLVERLSKQRLDRYMQTHIFEPLQMHNTGFMLSEESATKLAEAYDAEGQNITKLLPPSSDYTRETTFHSGGGGLASTAADWARFAAMLANDGKLGASEILPAGLASAMRENQLTPAQLPLFDYPEADFGQPGFSARFAGYGFGYSVGVRLKGAQHSIPGADGEISWGGLANTQWLAVPETGLVALVFSQYFGADAAATDQVLRETLFGPD